MISLHDYLYQHTNQPPPANVQSAAMELLNRVYTMLADSTCPLPDPLLRSGYRPIYVNAITPNASRTSKHMTGEAIDLADDMGLLDSWLTDEILEGYDLYREAPASTPTWCHLQTVAPMSGRRTFLP